MNPWDYVGWSVCVDLGIAAGIAIVLTTGIVWLMWWATRKWLGW